MKFSWGTGIALFIIVFVTAILSMVYFAFQQKINLVSKDYYPKEVEYQKRIQQIKNTALLSGKFSVQLKNDTIHLVYPNEFNNKNINGNVKLYRPSDFELDNDFEIDTIAETLKIPVKELDFGKYYLQVEIATEGKEYYYETDLYIKKSN